MNKMKIMLEILNYDDCADLLKRLDGLTLRDVHIDIDCVSDKSIVNNRTNEFPSKHLSSKMPKRKVSINRRVIIPKSVSRREMQEKTVLSVNDVSKKFDIPIRSAYDLFRLPDFPQITFDRHPAGNSPKFVEQEALMNYIEQHQDLTDSLLYY